MTDDMSSKNSNNSDIEVINPEDLEESPPPTDNKAEATEENSETKAEEVHKLIFFQIFKSI